MLASPSRPARPLHRRLLIGSVSISILISAVSAGLLYLSQRTGEREEIEAWIQSTALFAARAVGERHLGPIVDPARPADAVEAELRSVFETLRRDLDERAGQPVVEMTVLNLSVVAPGPDGGGRIVAALRPDPGLAEAWDAQAPGLRVGPGRGQVRLRAVAPIRQPDGTVAGAVVIDAGGAYLAGMFREAALGAGLVFVVGVLSSFWLARRYSRTMSRPAEVLAAGMEAVQRGDFGVRVEPDGSSDEFDRLSAHFNSMVAGLRDRRRMRLAVEQAAEAQRLMLPGDAPRVPGYALSARAEFCDELGGDYYDLVPLHGGQLGLVVGDVCGHGFGAAVLMASSQSVLRAALRRHAGQPETALGEVNRELCAVTGNVRFVTAFAGVLDPATHRLVWSSAGHEPALVLRADGSIERLSAAGPPLGVIEDAVWTRHETPLWPGDTLIVLTDGIRERAGPDGQRFGQAGLASALADAAAAAPEALAAGILDACEGFARGRAAEDDLTVLVVRRER